MGEYESDPALEAKMTPEEKAAVEEIRSTIGKEIPFGTVADDIAENRFNHAYWNEGADDVAIKRFCVATFDYNRLWFDDEYAKKTRWGGRIAPPLFLMAVCLGTPTRSVLRIINERKDAGKLPTHMWAYQSLSEWEFFEPVRLDDKIEFSMKLTHLYWHQGREKRLLLSRGTTTYTNQKEQTVGICTGGDVHAFKELD